MSDDNVESYQLPSHQLELPVILAQDSIDSFYRPCISFSELYLFATRFQTRFAMR